MGVVLTKLRASARGQECTLRLPGICIGGTETTVLAHIWNEAAGKATKADDWSACFSCAACHREYDQGLHFDSNERRVFALPAMQRTQRIWFALGLLRIAGDDEPERKRHKPSKLDSLPKKPSWRVSP